MAITTQVMLLIDTQGKHYWTHELVFLNMFYDEDDYTDPTIDRIQNLFTLEEVIDKINSTIENYYGIDDGNQLDKYDQMLWNDKSCILAPNVNKSDFKEGDPCPIQIDINYITSMEDSDRKYQYSLTEDDRWIFTDDAVDDGTLKAFLNNITSFTLSFDIVSDYDNYQDYGTSCFYWQIKAFYGFENRNLIQY